MPAKKVKFFLVLFIFSFFLQSCKEDDISLLEPIEYSPKLKKLMIFNTLEDESPWVWDLYEYDDKWRLVKKTGYSGPPSNPWVTGYQKYEYDSSNRLIKESIFCGQNISFCGYWLYSYSGNNLIVKASFDELDVFGGSQNWDYDSRGNKIKSWSQDTDGNVYSVAFFEYDDRNNCIKEISSSAYWLHSYDVNNKRIETKVYNIHTNELNTHYTFEYEGELLFRHNYWHPVTGIRWFMTEYFYDENGNLIEVVDEKDGVRNVFRKIKYDVNNLKIEAITYDRFFGYAINSIVRYEYYFPLN